MAELKPCPFCGGEAALWGGFDGYEAYCINCQAKVEREGRAETIEAWNRRAEDGKRKTAD